MIPFGQLKAQTTSIETELRVAIDEVLNSGWYVLGSQLSAFEAEFAAYLGVRHAIGVGSGTEALHLALRALGAGANDEVITAANTCVPTASAISFCGATPALADCDPLTLTIDPDSAQRTISRRTKVIIPVHLYGHPCDMAPLLEISRRHSIPILEDCAQAHGATYRGQKCGTFGDLAAFSFYPSKNLGALGDAGAVVTNDDALAQKLRLLRNYGEESRYHHVIEGFNSRLDEIQAAILRVKLRHLDAWNAARRERAALYRELLNGLPVQCPADAEYAVSNYHLFAIRTPERDSLQGFLTSQNIGTLIHYPIPIHLQGAYKHLGMQVGTLPNAERAAKEVLSLPLYPELPLSDIQEVAKKIRQYFATR